MRNRFKIIVYALLYFLLCGKSCQNEQAILLNQEKEVEAVKESIANEFESEGLSEEARAAAEMNAIQKVGELEDYLKVFSDVTMDSLFRQKAAEMIRGIFIPEGPRLSFGGIHEKEMERTGLGVFLLEGFGKDVISASLRLDSVRIIDPLHRSTDESYTGTLSAYQKLSCFTLQDTIIFPGQHINITIFAFKTQKIFGDDTLRVWTVSLGDMVKVD